MSFKEIKRLAKSTYKKEMARNVSAGLIAWIFKFSAVFLLATVQFVCVQNFGDSFIYGYPSLLFYVLYAAVLFLVILPVNFGVDTYYTKAVKGSEHHIDDIFSFFSKEMPRAIYCQLYFIIMLFLSGLALIVAVSIYAGIFINADISIFSTGFFAGAAVIAAVYFAVVTVIALKYSALAFCAEKYPQQPAETIIKKAVRLVKGSKFTLLKLLLSSIGWILLGIITCGIGFIWVMPYLGILTKTYFTTLERSF